MIPFMKIHNKEIYGDRNLISGYFGLRGRTGDRGILSK
jgi:hypothetical protein